MSKGYVTVGKTLGDFPLTSYPSLNSAINAAFDNSPAVLLIPDPTPYVVQDSVYARTAKRLYTPKKGAAVVQMAPGRNKTVLTNTPDADGFTSDFQMDNITIDQQGELQTAATGITVKGIRRWSLNGVTIRKSYKFNFLALHQDSSAQTRSGNITLTVGSEVAVGVGTYFTQEVKQLDILKVASGQFCRVAHIIDDTHLILSMPWGWLPENNTTFKVVQPNDFNYFNDMRFEGTVNDADASGYGLFDNSTVANSYSFGAAGGGCGYVPDHTRAMAFINCHASGHNNAGFSFETCEEVNTIGGSAWGNGNGHQLIVGSMRCKTTMFDAYMNKYHGYVTGMQFPNIPIATENTYDDCSARENLGYGSRVDGSHRNGFNNMRFINNNAGSAILNAANGQIPFGNQYNDCQSYDTRTVKKTLRGLYIYSADATKVRGGSWHDADHVMAGIVDQGTNTSVVL